MSEIPEKIFIDNCTNPVEPQDRRKYSLQRMYPTDHEYHLAPRWVSVEKELPDKKELETHALLVGWSDGAIIEAWIDDGKLYKLSEVTDIKGRVPIPTKGALWMLVPLPAPPEVSND